MSSHNSTVLERVQFVPSVDENGECERVFFSGSEYFSALIADIELASRTIELETYIFAVDVLGKRIIQSLIGAAQRGVEVRVLVDGAGTPDWGGELVQQLEAVGAKTRIFHPLPWRLWQWSRTRVRTPLLLKALYLLFKINSRNHRKICMIDRKVLYAGSFNISHHHLSSGDGSPGWRDTGVRVAQLPLDDLVQAFEAAWVSWTPQERIRQFFQHLRTDPVIRLNNSRHRRRILYKNLLTRIKGCCQRIWITNAYFVPDTLLLRRLIDAAGRGVDVRILLPSKSDLAFMPWASQTFYEKLLKSGVRIFEYLPSILHAKTLILDNWMMVGSSNLNHRSLLHDLEVDINLRSIESKQCLVQQFLEDLRNSREVLLEIWQQRRWFQRIVGVSLLYLKYLI